MSHFAVMVINSEGIDDVKEQLAPFSENIQVEEYLDSVISEERFQEFREHYTSATSTDYSNYTYKIPGNLFSDRVYAERDMSQHAPLSDEELYAKFGDDWNGMSWKFEEGEWRSYSTYNPESKWDWYQVGGRWCGFLRTREMQEINPSHTYKHGEGLELLAEKLSKNVADRATKGEVLWDEMMVEAGQKAAEKWDKVSVIGIKDGKIKQPVRSWEQCREFFEDISEARTHYHDQPQIKAFKEVTDWENIEDYDCTCEEFIERGRNTGIATFAVLKDGEWIEKGEMGWFGCSTETPEESLEWEKGFYDRFIKDLPDNALITVVDCHI